MCTVFLVAKMVTLFTLVVALTLLSSDSVKSLRLSYTGLYPQKVDNLRGPLSGRKLPGISQLGMPLHFDTPAPHRSVVQGLLEIKDTYRSRVLR
jgi:hypothetical protein